MIGNPFKPTLLSSPNPKIPDQPTQCRVLRGTFVTCVFGSRVVDKTHYAITAMTINWAALQPVDVFSGKATRLKYPVRDLGTEALTGA